MDEQQNIQPMQSDIERVRKETADGKEYWSARELSNVMGYSTWQKFNRVLNKALQVAQSRGMNISEHFNQTVEMVKLGSGTFRKVDNWHLSRLACLIIAENADSKKPQVQTARQYFKEQTPATVLIESQVSSRILLYKTNQGETRIEVVFNSETFWLSQKRMADLYGVDVRTVSYHLSQIYESGELKEEATIRKIGIVQMEGEREVNRPQMLYNLDAIIAVGYRVNSYQATQFRIWATAVLKELIIERIREIRTSERRYYQKITDVYAECSADYDAKAETTKLFFKMVQNMMHWAVTHQTAAEIIYTRADAKMPHMGLTTWKNAPDGRVQKSDTIIAKNYLSDKEVTSLNRLSNAFLDVAEDRADRQLVMTMADWKKELERFLGYYRYDILENAGTVSAEEAKEKAYAEYDKFRIVQDREYLSDFDQEIKKWRENGLFDDNS